MSSGVTVKDEAQVASLEGRNRGWQRRRQQQASG
jgi:hypothetical protein